MAACSRVKEAETEMQIDFRGRRSRSRVGGKFPVKNMSLGTGQWVSLLGPNFVFHSTMLL